MGVTTLAPKERAAKLGFQFLIVRLRAGWETLHRSAARVKLSVYATVKK